LLSRTPTLESAGSLVFDYPQNPDTDPTTVVNVDAARVNVFYIVNTMHDIAYRLVPGLPIFEPLSDGDVFLD
jgi:hypothetical protein